MRKLMIRLAILVVFVSTFSIANGQNFGYINSEEILSAMPEVKQADTKLNNFSTQLQKKGQKMVEDFQAKYQALAEKQQNGQLSPKQVEEEGAKLQAEEQKIAQFEQEVQKQVLEKRQELLQPIYDRINAAIKEVATEGNYQYIFDLGVSGFILYADESQDVTSKVKAKL